MVFVKGQAAGPGRAKGPDKHKLCCYINEKEKLAELVASSGYSAGEVLDILLNRCFGGGIETKPTKDYLRKRALREKIIE